MKDLLVHNLQKIKFLLLLISFGLLANQALSQNLYLDEMKFTDRILSLRNMSCTGNDYTKFHFYLNGSLFTDYTVRFFYAPTPPEVGGVYHINVEFGILKPGDVMQVKDDCGHQSNIVTVKDDYVYVEVPNGASYHGNGIGPNDSSSPYARSVNPVQSGKCELVKVNSHALFQYAISFNTGAYQTGAFKINGLPLKSSDVSAHYYGSTNGSYSINADGSINVDNDTYLGSNTYYSGQSPLTIEYTHNGQDNNGDFSIGIGGMQIRFIKNGSFSVWKRNYLGEVDKQDFAGAYSNASYKITYDGEYYRLSLNGTVISELRRFVVYSATGGNISPGGSQNYGTQAIYTPNGSGIQTISALIDGAVYAAQRFNVAEDITINPTIINSACSGGNTGRIIVNTNGGQSPMQYALNNGASTNINTFNNLAAGNYTIRVQDASGCSATRDVSVSENAALSFSVSSQSNNQCSNTNNGSVSFQAGGGTAPFSYSVDGANYQTDNTFNNLSAGNYTFWLKDANNCLKSLTVTIGNDSYLQASTGLTQNVSCFGGNNGQINVSTTGSIPSGVIQYSKDGVNYQSSSIFTNLTAGTYAISIKDNICQTSFTTSISQPSALDLSTIISSQVLCYNGNTGQISASGTGGAGGYQYSIDGNNYQTNGVFSGLKQGNYKIWVKDVNGCIKESGILSITQPTELKLTLSNKTDVKCYGGNNGTVMVAGSGGIQAYTYAVDGGTEQTSGSFNDLKAGNHTFSIKDQNGCTKSLTIEVIQPKAALSLQISAQQNLVCNQDNTGKVTLHASGGTFPYEYSKDNSNFQNSDVFQSLRAEDYTFIAKDANGCNTSVSTTITQPTPLVVSLINKTDVNCEYQQKGQFTVIASGSNGNYSYSLNGMDFKNNPVAPQNNISGAFTNLLSGNYTITATDGSGCSTDFPVTVSPKFSQIRFDVSKSLPGSCSSTDGTININNVRGGSGNYSYGISSQTSFSTNPDFSNLSNGTYVVTVADELCAYNQSVDLLIPASLKAAYSLGFVSCQIPNANLDVYTISGGNGNYELSLDGGVFSGNRIYTNLVPKVYNLQIKDNPVSCKTNIAIEIKPQNASDISLQSKQDIACFNGSDGKIVVIGNNNMGPFQYRINNEGFSASNTFGNLRVGLHRLYAQNSVGCIDSIQVILTQPTQLNLSLSKQDNNCFGDQTGSINASSSGGTSPYKYALNPPDYQTENLFGNLSAGTYTVTAKDEHGCLQSHNVTLTQPSKILTTPIYKDTITCHGVADGAIQLLTSGGVPGYLYSKDSVNYLSDNTFSALNAGNYNFWIKDSHQCLMTSSLKITEPDSLKLSLVKAINPLCAGTEDGIIELKAVGGNGGNVYWRDNAFRQQSVQFTGLSQGEYSFKVEDRKACNDNIRSVKLSWPIGMSAQLSTSQPICYGDSTGAIKVIPSGGTGSYNTYILRSSADTLKAQKDNINYNFKNIKAGSYNLWVSDANGCSLSLNANIAEPDSLEHFIFGSITGKDSVCVGQQVVLDVKNAGKTINWFFDGQEGSAEIANRNKSQYQVVIPGVYSVRISNKTGCSVSDTFELKNSKYALKADFLIPTQAFVGDTVVALDITKPVPNSIYWLLPQNAQKVYSNTNTVAFVPYSSGEMNISLFAISGDCQNVARRNIKIFERSDIDSTGAGYQYQNKPIESVFVYPNPSNGYFSLKVLLRRPAAMKMRLVKSNTGETVLSKTLEPTTTQNDVIHEYDFNLVLATGIYSLILETSKQQISTRVVIIN